MQPGVVGQLFLRQFASAPQVAHPRTELVQVVRGISVLLAGGHAPKLWIGCAAIDCGSAAFRLASWAVSPAKPSGAPMIKSLYNAIETDLADLREHGRMSAADQLAASTGHHFNSAAVPHYFTGDVAARFVLVHLNPKQADDFTERYVGEVPTLASYLDAHAHFGRDAYGPKSPRKHRSRFDHKQIRFVEAFGSIEFVPDNAPDATFINLERVVDQKLQLEAVPYGSDNFTVARRQAPALAPHFARLLDVIVSVPRDYIIFCGSVFIPLLAHGVTKEHTFRLQKVDGTMTRNEASFFNLQIEHGGRTITAGIASTYAQQGIPMRSYAAECAARY